VVTKLPVKEPLLPVHHSLSDFDWQYGASFRSLDPAWYTSSPTSLKIAGAITGTQMAWLLRTAPTQALSQGRIDSSMKRGINAQPGFCFRNQRALGGADWQNCYVLVGYGLTWQLQRWVGGAYTAVGTTGTCLVNGESGAFRVDFWNGENLAGTPALCVALYRSILAVWTLDGPILYDTTNKWNGNPVNRVGLFTSSAASNYLWFDDTNFWIP